MSQELKGAESPNSVYATNNSHYRVCVYLDVTLTFDLCSHGRRSRGDSGDKSPQNLEREDANANCPPRFCHIGTKMSVLWPSKYAKIRFRTPLGELPTLSQTP